MAWLYIRQSSSTMIILALLIRLVESDVLGYTATMAGQGTACGQSLVSLMHNAYQSQHVGQKLQCVQHGEQQLALAACDAMGRSRYTTDVSSHCTEHSSTGLGVTTAVAGDNGHYVPLLPLC